MDDDRQLNGKRYWTTFLCPPSNKPHPFHVLCFARFVCDFFLFFTAAALRSSILLADVCQTQLRTVCGLVAMFRTRRRSSIASKAAEATFLLARALLSTTFPSQASPRTKASTIYKLSPGCSRLSLRSFDSCWCSGVRSEPSRRLFLLLKSASVFR